MKGIQPAVKALIEKFKKAKGVERDSIRAKIRDVLKRDPKEFRADVAKMMEIHPAMLGADILIDTLLGVLMEEGLIAEIGAGPVGSLEKIAQEYRSAKEGVEKEKLRAVARKMARGKPENVKKMVAGKMGIYPRMLGADTVVERIDLLIGEGTIEEQADPMAKERMPKLYLELERAILKKTENLPGTAPVYAQMIKSLAAVKNRIKNKFNLTGREAVKEFINATKGHFTFSMPPLSRLSRKYRSEIKADPISGNLVMREEEDLLEYDEK